MSHGIPSKESSFAPEEDYIRLSGARLPFLERYKTFSGPTHRTPFWGFYYITPLQFFCQGAPRGNVQSFMGLLLAKKWKKEAQGSLAPDSLSSMPDNVITNILDRLAIQYAVRTDVLLKNWRFKWTLVTQVVFDEYFIAYLQYDYGYCYKYYEKDIYRLLLHLKGPITKFVLYIPEEGYNTHQLIDVKDIYHWVLFLTRQGIKDFTFLYMSRASPFKLPTQLLSCTELEHLKLERCCLPLLPSFSGFPNLLSLELDYVTFGSYRPWEFLARCPSLEILKIRIWGSEGELNEIAKLVKLKMLHLSLGGIDGLTLITKLSPLPKLQELTLDLPLAEDGVKKFPATFLCLKTLTISNVYFDDDVMISFLFEMICGFPNLQTLEITAIYMGHVPPPQTFSHIHSMGQLQLQSVVFGGFRGSETEVYLIEFLLARSPFLKKISIGLKSSKRVGGADGKFMFANKLLKLYRASPVVEIDLY